MLSFQFWGDKLVARSEPNFTNLKPYTVDTYRIVCMYMYVFTMELIHTDHTVSPNKEDYLS